MLKNIFLLMLAIKGPRNLKKNIKNEERNSKEEYECEVGAEKEENICRIQSLESKEEKDKEILQ